MGDRSLPLVEAIFRWARFVQPHQPLSTGIWNTELHNLNEISVELSDIITFHNYHDLNSVEQSVQTLQQRNRPILCTEWMSRKFGSLFETHLPFFKREQIGCYFWGLVNGRTQTHLPWSSSPGVPEPPVWSHDLLRSDGLPYLEEERTALRANINNS